MTGIAFRPSADGSPVTDFHTLFDDFDLYLATSWVITETGSGTRAISQTAGGNLLITNAAADDDHNYLQQRDVASGQVAEHWTWVSGKRLYFGARFKVSDVTQSDFVMGLQITDTSPLGGSGAAGVSDGIYFAKDDGDALLDLMVGASSTFSAVAGAKTLANDTWYTMEFYYDGVTSTIQFFVDGVPVGGVATTNAPTTELCISFAIQNGEAVAKTMTIDWIRVAQER